jgi:hypothetical protein
MPRQLVAWAFFELMQVHIYLYQSKIIENVVGIVKNKYP